MLLPLIRRGFLPHEPLEIFRALYRPGRRSFFFDSHGYAPPKQRWSYIGFDPFLEVTAHSDRLRVCENGRVRSHPIEKIFPVLREIFARYPMRADASRDFFCGGAAGFWAYEFAEFCEKIKFRRKKKAGTPLLYLGFYRDIIAYDHRCGSYVFASLYDPLRPGFSKSEARKRVGTLWEETLRRCPKKTGKFAPPRSLTVRDFCAEMNRKRFETMVRRAKEYIGAGDIYQANLSQRFSFGWRGNPLGLYEALKKINPSPFAAFLDTGEIKIVSSSPERLIRKRGRLCETSPIAGTRPRSGEAGGEKRLARRLRGSAKERAEHIMLVDLERNDLGRVCDWPTVKVEKLMRVENYSHVAHLVSEISGRLSEGKDALDLIRAMFPGGTITGCPKVRCMEIIDQLEPVERGIYTGSLGYLGFDGDMELNIVIRTLILKKSRGFLQVGAGIVYDSDPRREYEETLHKAEALLRALGRMRGKSRNK
jgi:para-aminobenzoate synthetase component 1